MVDFHNEVLIKRYRKEAIAEVAKRKREGCITVLVSATFEVIALCAQEVLGTDAVIATKMEVDPEGNYTGRVEGDVTQGSEKPRAVKEWADGAFGPGNWEVAYAYGDHFSDYAVMHSEPSDDSGSSTLLFVGIGIAAAIAVLFIALYFLHIGPFARKD